MKFSATSSIRAWFASFAALLFVSCEKNISIDLPSVPSQVVVEGHIETGQGAWVVLTRSSPYFAVIDTTALLNSIVKNALVTVSDGIHTDTLPMIFDPAFANTTYIPWYYKKINPTVIGQVGGHYSLKVVTGGQTLTAVTSMPSPAIKLDSVWFKLHTGSDTLGLIWAHLSDPANEQNFYRWYAKRLKKDKRYLAPVGATFNDKFINGTKFSFAYNRGSLPGSTAPDDNGPESGYFLKGDSVVVKFCSIDYYTYQFYASYELASESNGNPFGSPANVQSNIQGGLGIWAGFSPTFDTLTDKPHP